MPGPRPQGDRALTSAERMRRLREKRKAEAADKPPVVIRYRRPKDRRSRPDQWADAISTLTDCLDRYQEWHDNLPVNLANSALAECLDAVLELRDLVDQLSIADLPRGLSSTGPVRSARAPSSTLGAATRPAARNVVSADVLTDEAATILAAKLKTPLQIGQHLVRAFEAGFEIGAKPIDASVVEATLSRQLNDLEPQLTRNGYDVLSLVEQFDAKPSEIHQLLRGDLDPGRPRELMDEMRAAGLPT